MRHQLQNLIRPLLFVLLLTGAIACDDNSTAEETDILDLLDATDGTLDIGEDQPGDTDPGDLDPGDTDTDAPSDVPQDEGTPDLEPDVQDTQELPDLGMCTGLRYVTTSMENITNLESMAINEDRSFRVAVDYTLSGCERRARPVVTVNEMQNEVAIQLHVFDDFGVDCPAMETPDTRIVTLQLAPGDWTIYGLDSDNKRVELAVTVGPGSNRPCGTQAGACEKDCDCEDRSERCLSGFGLGGPFAACAVPCESNQDCADGTGCTSFDDGLEQVCRQSGPPCAAGDCPAGFVCDAEGPGCEPDYVLNGSNRVPCNCDADCETPLRCVHPNTINGNGSCEYPCPTAGDWCAPGHVCGMDLGAVDGKPSTCGWVGE